MMCHLLKLVLLSLHNSQELHAMQKPKNIVEINSAKIQSLRGKAKDLFLISKNGEFCDNKDLILEKLIES